MKLTAPRGGHGDRVPRARRGLGWDSQGGAQARVPRGQGRQCSQHLSPPKWEAPGREDGVPGGPEGLTWSRVRSSSSSLSSSRLRLMRSRRRFSTSGFSIWDQQERESGPTGPRLSAAARAWGPRGWDSPASAPLPQTPESLGPDPLDPPPLPLPAPLGSVSAARLLSLPGLPHPPLSVSSSLLPSLCLSSSFLSTSPHRAVSLCLSGEL